MIDVILFLLILPIAIFVTVWVCFGIIHLITWGTFSLVRLALMGWEMIKELF